MECRIRGCRNLQTVCRDCNRVVCTASIGNKWSTFKDHEPLTGIPLLVKKHYIDHEWDIKNGGYDYKKPFETESFVDVSTYWGEGRWDKGGVVTEWTEIPE